MKYGYARVSTGRSGPIHVRELDGEIVNADVFSDVPLNVQAGVSVSDSEQAGLPA
jgi:hypothetical protein